MCGIGGAFHPDPGLAQRWAQAINLRQAHRGPDDSVVVRVAGATLGNTRLAIQDPGPSGNQPFVSSDGRYHCVFNGEIYNHLELVRRHRLPTRTVCDGEVIPELWARMGPASLGELRGMYAIALVDKSQDVLYLARDPFGIKPLYWRQAPGGTVFASEPRSLAGIGGSPTVDAAAVARFLYLGAMASDQSPFREIRALAPNSVIRITASGVSAERRIIEAGVPDPGMHPSQALGDALLESVDLHLNADVPSVLLLSSGVDSAVIAASAAKLGRNITCLTVSTGGADDESAGASETARHYGHPFQRVPANLRDKDVTEFFDAMQRPSIDGMNTFVINRAVHEAGFKVALSGLGGDEAVGGYSHFRLLKLLPYLKGLDKMPDGLGRAVGHAVRAITRGREKAAVLASASGPRTPWALSALQRQVLPAALAAELTHTDLDGLPADSGGRDGLAEDDFAAMVRSECALYMQPMLLADADAFSMSHSVELRVPLVDTAVFAAAMRQGGGRRTPLGKAALGRALEDPYVEQLAGQTKRGFSVPMRQWMIDGPLAPLLTDAQATDAPIWSIVDRSRAERAGLLPLHAQQRWSEPWALVALNAWLASVDAVQDPA